MDNPHFRQFHWFRNIQKKKFEELEAENKRKAALRRKKNRLAKKATQTTAPKPKPKPTEKPKVKPSTKLPYLLMTPQQKKSLKESINDPKQLSFGNTQTVNFDICPGALEAFGKLVQGTQENETKLMQSTADLHAQVALGIQLKPDNIRKMQFKQYYLDV